MNLCKKEEITELSLGAFQLVNVKEMRKNYQKKKDYAKEYRENMRKFKEILMFWKLTK